MSARNCWNVVALALLLLSPAAARAQLDFLGPGRKSFKETIDAETEEVALRRIEEANKARKQIEAERKQLLRKIRAYEWQLGQFERDDDPNNAFGGQLPGGKRLQQLREIAQVRKAHLLDPVSGSRDGAIQKGSAHNFFLSVLGKTAMQRRLVKQKLETERRLSGGQPLDAERSQLLATMEVLGDGWTIRDSDLLHIRFSRGLTGRKLTGRLGEGPLDTKWPRALLREKYARHRQAVERLKAQAMAELREGAPVTEKTADALQDAVQEFYAVVKKDLRARTLIGFDDEYYSLKIGGRHLDQLVAGTARFLEASSYTDLEVAGGSSVEEIRAYLGVPTEQPLKIEDLIAYMYENDLNFIEADPNGDLAYRRLFESMVSYYSDLKTLQRELDGDRELTQQMLAQEKELLDVATGTAISGSDKARMMIAAQAGEVLENSVAMMTGNERPHDTARDSAGPTTPLPSSSSGQ